MSRTEHIRSRRLPVVGFVLVAAGLVGYGVLLYGSMGRAAQERAVAELDAVATLKAAAIAAWRTDQARNAVFAASHPYASRIATHGVLVPDGTRTPLEGLQVLANFAEWHGYLRASIATPAGQILIDWRRPGEPDDPLPVELLREAAHSPTGVTRLGFLRDGDRPVLDAAAPLSAGGYVLFLRAEMSSLFGDLTRTWPEPRSSAAAGLATRNGERAVLFAPQQGAMEGAAAVHVPLSHDEITGVRAARAAAGEGSTFQATDTNGRAVLAAVRPLPDSDWSVVARMDLAEVYAPFRRPFASIVVLGLALVAAGGLLIALWWRADSQRARVEGDLRASREVFELALAGTHYVWDWDLVAGRFSVDDDLARTFGYESGTCVGSVDKVCETFIHPDDLPEAKRRLAFQLYGETDVLEVEHRTPPDKLQRWLLMRGRVSRRDAQGRALRITGVVSDITERRAMQAHLERSERMASLGTLAAGVAHEINNPLAYLLVNLNYMAEELAGEAAARPELIEALAEAREGAERVRDVMRGLRTFARPGSRQRLPNDIPVELEAAARLARNEVRHRARLDLDIGPTPMIEAGEHELGQVFLNLLINAAHAIPEGRADENVITVRAGTDASGWAVVEVRDTGIGMTPEVLARVFEPFFTTKADRSGTGLGLAIAHGIVSGAGGRIEAESEPGRGSVFRVLLPPASSLVLAPQRFQPAPPAGIQRLRVLVVDDDPVVARAIVRALGSGWNVTAAGATDALTRIESGERFDAILCDVMMPQVSGKEIHERLSASVPDQARRVVFVTAGAFSVGASEFLRGVANPCIEKPFDKSQLREAVEQVARA